MMKEVTAWSNSRVAEVKGSYGFRVYKADLYYFEGLEKIKLVLPEHKYKTFIEVTIKDSFWEKCPELKHPKITTWFKKNIYATWTKRHPYKFPVKWNGVLYVSLPIAPAR